MNLDIFSALTHQSTSFVVPAQKLNKLAIAYAEKLVAFQIASLRSYADLGFAQWKAAAEVKDSDSFLAFLAKQGEHMIRVGEQGIADANKASQLSMDFVSDSQKVAQENVATVTELPTKKVARKAAA